MVNWSVYAKNDLKTIFNYIKKDSEVYAKKVTDDIIEKSELLNSFPDMGRIVPEISEHNVREIFVYSYRIIYEITGGDIFILTLVHFSQNFEKDIPQ
jgi:toxin ParE1/3/4